MTELDGERLICLHHLLTSCSHRQRLAVPLNHYVPKSLRPCCLYIYTGSDFVGVARVVMRKQATSFCREMHQMIYPDSQGLANEISFCNE